MTSRIIVYVFFFTNLLTVMMRMLLIPIADYPRKVEWTRGQDMVILISSTLFALWAGIILWWHA